jgi:hypothetical protein
MGSQNELNSEQFSELEAYYYQKIRAQQQDYNNNYFRKPLAVPELDFDSLGREAAVRTPPKRVDAADMVTPDYQSSQVEFRAASASQSKKRDFVRQDWGVKPKNLVQYNMNQFKDIITFEPDDPPNQ